MNKAKVSLLAVGIALMLFAIGCDAQPSEPSKPPPEIEPTVTVIVGQVKERLTDPTHAPVHTPTLLSTAAPAPSTTRTPRPTVTLTPALPAVSTPVPDTTTTSAPETCSTTVSVVGDTSPLNATVAALVEQFENLADPSIPLADRERARAIAQRARHAVVHISNDFGGGTGSFISADGYIVTNAHIVADATSLKVVTFDGSVYQGEVVATVAALDPDLALVKVDAENLAFLPLAEELTVGETVVYVGHPALLPWASAGGTITGTEEQETWTDVVFTNPTAGGASGSALLNCDGEIVAINYGGTVSVPDREQVNDILQNVVIWDSVSYMAYLKDEKRGIGIDTLRAFLSEHVPGLVESNEASRDSAVTRLANFEEPLLPADLCRLCLIEDQPDYLDYMRRNSLEKQIGFLKERLSGADPRLISAQDQAMALTVGKQTQHAVVRIAPKGNAATGSFITSNGYIITNAHVVEDATEVDVELFDGREYVAEVIGTTFPINSPDLALLKIEAENLPWLELASEVNVGDTVIGVGHPQLIEWAIFGGTVTFADAESFPRDYREPIDQIIQDDAVSVGPGASGSPMANLDGNIVYIKNSEGTDFTTPDETVKLRGEWMRPVVIWDQKTLNIVEDHTPMGIHADLVRRFVNDRVPGLLD